MPGNKITMLPDSVVAACTLDAGQASPAVSLYVTLDEATLEIQRHETRLERVAVAANLRHDRLDGLITEEWLTAPAQTQDEPQDEQPPGLPMPRQTLAFLYRLALHLKAQREAVRGKPENFSRPDYSFALESAQGTDSADSET